MQPAIIPHEMENCKLYFRPLKPQDFEALKAAHDELFPIDYEDSFYNKAVNGLSGIFSLAAFDVENGYDSLVGFITARLTPIAEVDALDRRHLGLTSASWNHSQVVYILTLGVLPKHQQKGVASTLIQQLEVKAAKLRARVVFLHVITYNTAAVRLYKRSNYQCMACMENFYNIRSGRQLDPSRTRWDAYLFMKMVVQEFELNAEETRLDTAMTPIRQAWDSCWPCFLRSPYSVVDSSCAVKAAQFQDRNLGEKSSNRGIFHRLFSRQKSK